MIENFGHNYKRAETYAKLMHKGQLRKYTGEDYVQHPIAVAQIVATVDHTEEMLMAAVLHDVVEDTDATIQEVCNLFGFNVAYLVYHLTDISQPEDGNRATRKAIDRGHNARGNAQAQTIKVADLVHNSASIAQHDYNFWKVYRHEKMDTLDELTLADKTLRNKAYKILRSLW